MEFRRQGPLPAREPVFAVSSAATVAGGLVVLGMGFYFLQRAPRPLPAPPPDVQVVERRVEVPVQVPTAPAPQAPPAVPSPPPVELAAEPPDEWTGVWRVSGKTLPMFDLKQQGGSLSGRYAPANWSGTYPFSEGTVGDGVAEFVVAAQLQQRLHFRLRRQTDGTVKAEAWMTPEDALVLLDNLKKQARTPQQLALLQAQVAAELRRLGKPTSFGTFRRVADPGAAKPEGNP